MNPFVLLLYTPKASKTIPCSWQVFWLVPFLTAFPERLLLPPVATTNQESCYGTYSSGSVQDSHLIPFSSHLPLRESIVSHKPPQRYKLFPSKKNCCKPIYYLYIGILKEKNAHQWIISSSRLIIAWCGRARAITWSNKINNRQCEEGKVLAKWCPP